MTLSNITRKGRFGWLFVIGMMAVAMLSLGFGGPSEAAGAAGNTVYVDADAAGNNDGTSWEHAFTDFQDGLDAAVSGDEIWVAAGTYKPSTEVGGTGSRYATFQMKNGVAVYGGFDPTVGDDEWGDRDWEAHVTILSGDIGVEGDNSDNCYHVFYHPDGLGLDGTAVLDGVTITEGNANGSYPDSCGGGMSNWSSSPTVTNCTFSGNQAQGGGGVFNELCAPIMSYCSFLGNSAESGGAIYNSASSPTVTNCVFTGNSAGNSGGGILNNALDSQPSNPIVNGGVFSANSAVLGGGIATGHSSPSLTDCVFSGNSALIGGGIFDSYSASTITNCTFAGNSASQDGGGMADDGGSSDLQRCTFSDNTAGSDGGAVHINSSGSPRFTNSVFFGNTAVVGGGIACSNWAEPVIGNCTFLTNSASYDGGAVSVWSGTPTISNSILWGDSPSEISMLLDTGTPSVTFSNVQLTSGPYPGTGNINADPRFYDPENGDFRLTQLSPCVDSGTNSFAWITIPTEDIDGRPRPVDGDGDTVATADMGAYEWQGSDPVQPIPEWATLALITVGMLSLGGYIMLRGRRNPAGLA